MNPEIANDGESTISPAASATSQGALNFLAPIALQAAHQETYSVPSKLANANPKRYVISIY